MTLNNISPNKQTAKPISLTGNRTWKKTIPFLGAAILILGVALWLVRLLPCSTIQIRLVRRACTILGTTGILTIFTFSLQRSLATIPIPIPKKTAYRLSMLIGVGVSLIGSSLPGMIISEPGPLPLLVSGLAGVMLGEIIATAATDGLAEDNFPPSAEIRLRVYQKHIQVIGKAPPTPTLKRALDLTILSLVLLPTLPAVLIIAMAIWLEDPGPIFFIKNSVGKGGLNFNQYKFRTMVRDAEAKTGPTLAVENDERTLHVGRVLRKTALDELPQLINILRGEMSFVGPRPQRTVLVDGYLDQIPAYAERHMVSPGISGLAQIMDSYYYSPKQKLRLDRIYIRHVSIFFDLKLLISAFLIVFWLRWKKDWDGRMARYWIRLGSKSWQRTTQQIFRIG